jgi:ADP-heptose:LPS heptosyltransferase
MVLRAGGLGELLTAVPALRALARAYPDHRRLLAAPHWLSPLLPLIVEEGEPCVDGLVDCDGLTADPAAMPGWPEVAVNLHGRGPESHRLLLATGPVELIAFHNELVPETAGMPGWRPDEYEVERWCRMLRSSGIRADRVELAIQRPTPSPPPWAHGATLIHPGASARCWPAERWAEIAVAEREQGRVVLISGADAEIDLARRIAAAAGLERGSVLAGRTDLLALAAFVAAAGIVICGDTGIAQLASALDVPSVVTFAPTSSGRWDRSPGDAVLAEL